MKALAIALTALTCAVAGGSQARAQSADDWDLVDGTTPGLTMASVAFSGGSAIAVRCQAGTLDVLVAGLPASTSLSRTVETTMPGIAPESETWLVQPGSGVISPPEPARIARMLRSGGHLDLHVLPEAEDAPGVRLALDYPASAAAIDRVLGACEIPLSDEHDAIRRLTSVFGQWERRPTPNFPERAAEKDVKDGAVRLGCVFDAEGRPGDCWILSETPPGVGFGPSALAAARDSRMSRPAGDGIAVVVFIIRFQIAN